VTLTTRIIWLYGGKKGKIGREIKGQNKETVTNIDMMMMMMMTTMIVLVVVMEFLSTGYLVGTRAVKTAEITGRPEAQINMNSAVRGGSVHTVIYDRRIGVRFATGEQTFATISEPPPRCTQSAVRWI
jgi:hypothetical protein